VSTKRIQQLFLSLQGVKGFLWNLRSNAMCQPPLEAVTCKPLILIEAPSPADPHGMLRVGKIFYKTGGGLNAV
jgi:hypothetical protein